MRILCGTFSFGVWVFELEFRVGVGEWNWRFENLVRNILVQCLSWSEELELELESGIFGNNQDKRSVRGADPTCQVPA